MNKVFIANRGEIALRIQRACRKLGIRSVIGLSEADAESKAAREAEQLIIIGPPAPGLSYLSGDAVIAAAQKTGCDALHPGYGFLSENAQFAERAISAGLTWIGPSPDAIRAVGSKTAGRAIARRAKVPVTPGTEGGLSDRELVRSAQTLGFPLIVKAVGGGGGRGMRIVRSVRELEDVLPRARGEALKNFADDAVYLERFLERPRHVEVQVMGDSSGAVLHFGTRDCSTQRRHQKLVEEAPAPKLAPALREKIHRAAVAIAKAARYTNAGTLEFLVEGNRFYFLEMNTRIQVEHPATEMVTGVDLVELQIRVARGERLPLKQREIKFEGHAIEFRINAEDPGQNFAPARGTIGVWRRPQAPGVREDAGYDEGDSVSLFYDGLLSKVIVHGRSRAQAIQRAAAFFNEYRIAGMPTSVEFHRWLLRTRAFNTGPVDIAFVGREFSAAALDDLAAAAALDESFRPPLGGFSTIERFHYHSDTFNRDYTVELLHQEGALFIARVARLDGKEGNKKFWRASNSRKQCLEALQHEVLEVVTPAKLLGGKS